MRIAVIIPAAGVGHRFGAGDKLAADFGGRPVLLRSVEPFTKREEVDAVVVAGPPDDLDSFRDRYGAQLGFLGGTIVEGGRQERWETVQRALDAVPEGCTHVAIHDGARPLVDEETIGRVFEAGRSHEAVVPGIPVRDTLKRCGDEMFEAAERDATVDAILGLGEGEPSSLLAELDEVAPAPGHQVAGRRVESTVDRSGIWQVQTPQLFEIQLLRRAYAQGDPGGATDDAMLVEQLGEPVVMVEGDPRNLKITSPVDLEIARALAGLRRDDGRPVHKRF
ncbi:MAG: 2-C-methyl-D-erythritol 4-phosphate cytidylyltransferase [Planctomycetota bacterium]|nr:2-C-methyl-D-erythritol 4-phosphate cytidylyltransferase [Planctomycetota bacterium]